MSEDDLPTQYYTEAGRQESFEKKHPIAKRRGSNAGGRGAKTAKWPHDWLEPRSLAEAGFIYNPEPGNLDNVMCFLCRRSICGWTDGDNPLEEHLKLSPDCGWAITACIEAKAGGIHLENPMSTGMIEARKATFGDRWPHDAKKGWKCKTKQLVEAGWIYKPTFDGDDFAECIYCTLALDGWELGDKPFHEHHVRSPECAFFELCKEADNPIAKKATKAKGRKARASNASKASTSSQQPKDQDSDIEAAAIVDSVNQTIVAEDDLEDHDDTTAATESSKMPRASGSRTALGRVTKKAAKATGKDSRRIQTDENTIMHDNRTDVEDTVIVKPPKPPRGKKRSSDELIPDMPPPPKRLTRKSVALDQSVMTETFTMGNSSSVYASTPQKTQKVATKLGNALFDERVVDDDAVEAELEAMAQEEAKQMRLETAKDPHQESVKEKATASRAAKKAKEAAEADRKAAVYQKQKEEREAAQALAANIEQEAEEKRIRILIEAEAERRKLEDEASARANRMRAEKEETEKKRLAAREDAKRRRQQEDEAKQRRAQAVEDAKQKKLEAEKAAERWKLHEEKQAAEELAQEKKHQAEVEEKEAAMKLVREKKHHAENEEKQAAMKLTRKKQREAEALVLEKAKKSARAKVARNSDEENRPPISKAPRTPSRRDGEAGLQTSRQWIAVDVDNVFDHLRVSPQEQDQNVRAITPIKAAYGTMETETLGAAERAMTVDDWIKYNASQTQEVLQLECQKMVREFDIHGVRARHALAGIGIVDSSV